MPRRILQPPGSNLCGQACVAMAAGVSLARAIAVIGHRSGTHTHEVRRALLTLGLKPAERLKRVSRTKPALPRRGIVAIGKGRKYAHWMLTWNGRIFDPGGRWPEGYNGWRITSVLEILE